ncbi:MAG: rubrerythrin family protein, partial [Mycobacteriaceae bacterium]|nr:rubrerythrin family protein [Mycobacteriaceae bacterium]
MTTEGDLRRWRQHLANERAEAAVYRGLAERRTGEERDILLAIAGAERRHEQHWLNLLGDQVGKPRRADLRTRLLGFLARHFGSVFVLALAQRAEARSPYYMDHDATPTMAADERIHEEVVRALATQ